METSKKNDSKKVVKKKYSNSTKKGNAEWNMQKIRQKVQYMAGTEFNTKKNINHYVNVRTNG